MHQAIPYRSWHQSIDTKRHRPAPMQPAISHCDVSESVSESAAIVFARRGCCMSHALKSLLLGLGANPAVFEVEEDQESSVVKELEGIAQSKVQLPAVFIGGSLFGGLDRVVATHIAGDLVPILKQAGALWL